MEIFLVIFWIEIPLVFAVLYMELHEDKLIAFERRIIRATVKNYRIIRKICKKQLDKCKNRWYTADAIGKAAK